VNKTNSMLCCYFAPEMVRSIAIFYLCVCVSVCLSAHISQKPHVRTYEIVCTCYLWPWLGPPLTTVQYVMYFRFVDDVMFSHSRTNTDTGLESRCSKLFIVTRLVALPNCASGGEVCYRRMPCKY